MDSALSARTAAISSRRSSETSLSDRSNVVTVRHVRMLASRGRAPASRIQFRSSLCKRTSQSVRGLPLLSPGVACTDQIVRRGGASSAAKAAARARAPPRPIAFPPSLLRDVPTDQVSSVSASRGRTRPSAGWAHVPEFCEGAAGWERGRDGFQARVPHAVPVQAAAPARFCGARA